MGKKGYGSCFGEDYQQYTKHIIRYVDNHFNNDKNIKILIPNAFDGLHILCTARRGFKLDCYETQDEFINGGTIDNFNIIGLKEKLKYFNYADKVTLYEKNFFEQKVAKEYDFLFCYKSLHLNCNKHIPKERKMRKLLSSVKENGLIYIFYHLAENEHDYINYPKEQYFRRLEMREYFDDSWEVIDIIENVIPSFYAGHPFNKEDHKHLVGHVFARKKYKRRKYKFTYDISISLD